MVIGLAVALLTCQLAMAQPPLNPEREVDTPGEPKIELQMALAKARMLLKQEQSLAAYSFLESLETTYARYASFNLLLGTAAVDAGKDDQAVLALQRVLLSQPTNSAARMELARAYYGLGDLQLARQEFESLKRSNPPRRAAELIDEYLRRINRAESAYQSRGGGYVEFEGGYNTNANGATNVSSFLNFLLDDESQQTPSAFHGIAAGGSHSKPLRPRWQALTAARVSYRNYAAADFIDTVQGTAAAQLQWKKGNQGARIGLIGHFAELNEQFNNRGLALNGSYWRPLASQWLLRATARVGVTRFAEPLAVRDVNQRFYGLSLLHSIPGPRQLQFELSAIGGSEAGQTDNQLGDRPFGRNLHGARFAASVLGNELVRLNLSVGWLNSDYDGPFDRDNGMRGDRLDDQLTVSLGMVVAGVPGFEGWSLRYEVRDIRNDSDISLYDYRSIQYLLTLRRDFE